MKGHASLLLAITVLLSVTLLVSDTSYGGSTDASAVIEGSTDTVILEGDNVLTKDTVIPAGVTVVLSCFDGDVGLVDGLNPHGTVDSVRSTEPYTTLDLGGYHLTVLGTLIVNAETGRPFSDSSHGPYDKDDWNITGGWAEVINDGGITVGDGGELMNYGSVVGEDAIEVLAGGTVGDLYTLDNWRFGSTTRACFENGIYPLNLYSMDNIECPIGIAAGGSYNGLVKAYVGGDFNSGMFPQVGDKALIVLAQGSKAVKTITPEGRSVLTITGDAEFTSCSLKIANIITSTKNFTIPLCDITLELRSGTFTVSSGFKAMPGAVIDVVDGSIVIEENASLAVYDYYDDLTSWYGTAYPVMDPAYIHLDSSSIDVRGALAGRVFMTGGSSYVIGDDARTAFSTLEATGVVGYGDTLVDEVWHRLVIIGEAPSRYITGYFTDAGLTEAYIGPTMVQGSVLFSGTSDVPVCESEMESLLRQSITVPETPQPVDGTLGLAVVCVIAVACAAAVVVCRQDVIGWLKDGRKVIAISLVAVVAVSGCVAFMAAPTSTEISFGLGSMSFETDGDDIILDVGVDVESHLNSDVSDLALTISFLDSGNLDDVVLRCPDGRISSGTSTLMFHCTVPSLTVMSVLGSVLENRLTEITADATLSGRYLSGTIGISAHAVVDYKVSDGDVAVTSTHAGDVDTYTITGLEIPIHMSMDVAVYDDTKRMDIHIGSSGGALVISFDTPGGDPRAFLDSLSSTESHIMVDGVEHDASNTVIDGIGWLVYELEVLS